jgi:hypothetical protein
MSLRIPLHKSCCALFCCTLFDMSAMQTADVNDRISQSWELMFDSIVTSKPHLDKMCELMHDKYGQIVRNTLKHYEFLKTYEEPIQGYIARLFFYNKEFHVYAKSLEYYIKFLKQDANLFEFAMRWLNGSAHELVQKDRLQRLLGILSDDSFKDGHKEFELLTLFNFSDV